MNSVDSSVSEPPYSPAVRPVPAPDPATSTCTLRPSSAVSTRLCRASSAAVTPVWSATALIPARSDPVASSVATSNPVIANPLIVTWLLSSSTTDFTSPPPTRVALICARTPLNSAESLIAATFAIADAALPLVETRSSAATLARMLTPLNAASFSTRISSVSTAAPSARAWRPRVSVRASTTVTSSTSDALPPTWKRATQGPVEDRLAVEGGVLRDAVDLGEQLVHLLLDGHPVRRGVGVGGRLHRELAHALHDLGGLVERAFCRLEEGDAVVGVAYRLVEPADLRGEAGRDGQTSGVVSRAVDPQAGAEPPEHPVQAAGVAGELPLRAQRGDIRIDDQSHPWGRQQLPCSGRTAPPSTSSRSVRT